MTVNFQEHQHEAKQSTVRLVVLFGAGLIAIILVVSLLVGVLFGSQNGEVDPLAALAVGAPLTTIGVVGTSLVKSSQIRSGGGSYVAQSLGGRPVDFNTLDPAEKQLANVVEEIAIASGMPVPAVFVLDEEEGINAFAAGWSADNAAIGVTRGALQHFTRRELQGVIAHEFAHIANGDTRVKTRIIGWVFGIAAITVLGRILLHSVWWAPRSRNNRDNGQAAIMALGIGLLVVGFVGTIFGRLVQAAVSRQREYLADASAVQYTRDPSSIGDALKKIAAFGADNKMHAAHATETQHLFFSSALGGGFATHPPLKDRIKRLLPDWDGSLPTIDRDSEPQRPEPRRRQQPAESGRSMVPGLPGFPGMPGMSGLAGAEAVAAQAAPALPNNRVAAGLSLDGPSEAHIEQARILLAQIPEPVQAYLHTRQGAVAAVLGLVASSHPASRERQLATAGSVVDMEPGYLDAAAQVINDLDRRLHLPAVDIALHSIGELPFRFKQTLISTIDAMDDDPAHRDLFSYMLRRAVIRHITDQDSDARDHHRHSLSSRAADATTLYTVIAHFNSAGAGESEAAFGAALTEAGLSTAGATLAPVESISFDSLGEALDRLADLDRPGRASLVRGAAAAVLYDGKTTVEEAELIRIVADAVRLPVPPLLTID